MRPTKLDGPATKLRRRVHQANGNVTPPEVFFDAARQAFERAAQGPTGVLDRYYRFGSGLVRLRFAGTALIPRLTGALEHLTTTESAPNLTVCLWDSASTGVEMPPPPWAPEDRLPRGEIRGYDEGRFRAAYREGAEALSLLDGETQCAVYWTRDARRLPYYESSAPLLTILHWWLGSRGCQVVHAGAVGTDGGGALLVGKSGSGKSTTALACLDAGMGYVGDDYCAVVTGSAPAVQSLYSSGKLNASDVERFPFFSSALINRERLDQEKALYLMAADRPEALARTFPLRAILLPQVTGRAETQITPVAAAVALRALAPSTIFQLPGAGEADFQRLSRLTRQVPSYLLALGTDLPAVPGAIRRVLEEN